MVGLQGQRLCAHVYLRHRRAGTFPVGAAFNRVRVCHAVRQGELRRRAAVNKNAVNQKSVLAGIALAGFFAFGPLAKAQETLYLSNIGSTPSSPYPIDGSDWQEIDFTTGANTPGYTLNAVEIEMADATGDPSGFALQVYTTDNYLPSSLIGVLDGSSTPNASGFYTYTANNITLNPDTTYAIVANATSPLANGSFEWDAGPAPTLVGGWLDNGHRSSDDGGADWDSIRSRVEVGIYATAVPEPSTGILLLIGAGLALFFRKTRFSF